MLVHAGPKVGKTWLAETAPAPRLYMQSGGETRFTPSTKVEWDPAADPPPKADGTWETCVVTIKGNTDIEHVYGWLMKGEHDFKSVIVDNFTLIQREILRSQFGAAMTQQQWGEHLPDVERKVTDFKNLVDHPTAPLDLVLFATGSKPELGKYTPFLMGQIRDNITYIIDVIGYLYTEVDGDQTVRSLLINDQPGFVAGTRVHALIEQYGPVIRNPNLTDIVAAAAGGSN